jgi:hypothetical protein
VKRLSTVFALTALAAATVALAQQQTAPQPQAQTPSSSQSQTPSDPKADKQALMKDCLTQVRAANPGADEKDIKDYCTKRVNTYSSSPHD